MLDCANLGIRNRILYNLNDLKAIVQRYCREKKRYFPIGLQVLHSEVHQEQFTGISDCLEIITNRCQFLSDV